MSKFQRSGPPEHRRPGALFTVVAALALGACLDNVPPELKPMVNSRLPRAVSGDHDFERVHVPSQFTDAASSADIVVTRSIPGGGTVEVTVATVKR